MLLATPWPFESDRPANFLSEGKQLMTYGFLEVWGGGDGREVGQGGVGGGRGERERGWTWEEDGSE